MGLTESTHTLGGLAEAVGLAAPADRAETAIVGVCALAPGRAGCIGFADDKGQGDALADTAAAAAIVPRELAAVARVPVLISERPKLAFARIAVFFEPVHAAAGVHATAVVAASARIEPSASVSAHAVIGADAVIAAHAVIGANTVIGASAHIGVDTRIASNVSVADRVTIGAGVRIEANAVIGARGFGLVHNGRGWEAVPQLGSVDIADAVEIGAGTTIDRGTFNDTRIETGVKIDDQVHIAHNCIIGAHTVIAGCTGIAGSATIGSNCMIGGGVGIGDHVRLADGVILTGASQVPRSIDTGGVYSSTFRAMPAADWRKRLALFRQLERIERRLRDIERADDPSKDQEPR